MWPSTVTPASPTTTFTCDGIKLGQWARDQRRKYRQGRVSAERVARLEALPGWAWSDRLDEQWERGFTA
uniref:helicase associated domain-containing protein n=1 Tax=Mycobacterium avium TaxID=1764 RepID=UPI0015C42E1C